MSGARAKHPLFAVMEAADAAWSAEVKELAKRTREHPGDLRYRTVAQTLPSYPTFKAAREAWAKAGYPMVVEAA